MIPPTITRLPILAPLRRWRHLRRLQCAAAHSGVTVTASCGGIELTRNQCTIILAAKHLLYAWDVIQSFDRYFEAVAPRPYRGGAAVDYSAPRLQHLRPDNQPWWFAALAEDMTLLEREYCHRYQPQPGDTVIDGGAYCGETALLFARLVGISGRVIAFEPDPASYDLLCYNLRAYGLLNVTPIKAGLWSASTRLPFASDGNLGAHVAPTGAPIEVMGLADACRNFCLERLGFLKLDIEGAEVAVIGAAAAFLADHRTHLAIANHIQPNGLQTYPIVEQQLRAVGYQTETCSPTGMVGWAGLLTYAEMPL